MATLTPDELVHRQLPVAVNVELVEDLLGAVGGGVLREKVEYFIDKQSPFPT